MSRPFIPTPAYRLFLARLIQTREDRGFTREQLGEYLGFTQGQVAAFESGDVPLGFIDVRNWLLALDMPFVQFTQEMEEILDSTLTHDEMIASPPTDSSPSIFEHMTTLPNPTPNPAPDPSPTIQVLFFAPDAYPVIRTIPNTLEAKQELVEGLITTFDTGIPGTVGIANDEALVMDMDPNRLIPATGAHIYGPFFVAGDVEGSFRSLTPRELEVALDHLAPEVPQAAFTALMRELEGGVQWMENWE